jgi:aryl-alcohol dehydrogenase-like predicted oxidoreductase
MLGRTGLRVSALGFGCGNVGGLMIRSTAGERERAVARALELGINYFDTAAAYGDGQSERNLGAVLKALRVQPYVGTKFRLEPGDLADVAGAVARALEASLGRLGLERVDLFQLHNSLAAARSNRRLAASDVEDAVIPALEKLRQAGKLGFYGITALGETSALHGLAATGALYTAQVCYNLLNPSAGLEVPPGFPGHDFRRLLDRLGERQTGAIVIRVLAGGALSGVAARHPVAVETVEPIASGPDYAADVARAQSLRALVDEGHAASLVEAALRFAIGHPHVSTVLLGYSSLEHLEYAAAAVARGPLPGAALARLQQLWKEFP